MMEARLIECELAERDTDPCERHAGPTLDVQRNMGPCGCRGGPTLDVLKDVQKAYEEQMEIIEKMPPSKKLQAQVDVLRSWVGDLVEQNSLLTRAVEELEVEATTQLFRERRKHSEMVLELRAELGSRCRQLARKEADLRGLLELLRRLRDFDNCTLNGIHFFELTESDIFGNYEIQKKKLDQGDSNQDTKQKSNRRRHHRL